MPDLGTTLLTLARNAIATHFAKPTTGTTMEATAGPSDDLPELHEMGATFVTLTKHGQLRGCIGSLEAWRPLLADVQENARSAALRDPRFNPLSGEELPITRVEVSLLTAAEPISFTSEADALAQLRPEVDGVIFIAGRHRATFLPQVWAQLPTPREFFAHLKRKAGLDDDFWADDVKLARYTVQQWEEA